MTEIKYKIRDLKTYSYVQMITAIGDVVNSTYGCIFQTNSEAWNYIFDAQNSCIRSGVYLDIERFEIEELRMTPYQTIKVVNIKDQQLLDKPDDEENVNYVKVILKTCVNDGFMTIHPRLINFILTYDKYQPILSELIPPHILQSIEEFNSVGIKGCDLDTLGSISLTASTEQLKMYDIEGLICRRENKISK